MLKNQTITKYNTGLLIVDVQGKLFSRVERNGEILQVMLQMISAFKILQLPIVVTEQYPQGLGGTIPILKHFLDIDQKYWEKTTFSCMGDAELSRHILSLPTQNWIVMGIEAHVCILQTVKGLLAAGKDPIVLNDAVTSRSLYDFSTAIAEIRDLGVRVTSAETILFELMGDSKVPEFKAISQLIKEQEQASSGGCCGGQTSCCG